jgi:hypothetical protein
VSDQGPNAVDTLFGEGNQQREDDFFQQARPAPVQQAPAPQPQGQRFIPEGFEPRDALTARRDVKQRELATLRNRLDKAGDADPARNPYANRGADGQPRFDQFKYDADQRAFQSLTTELSSLDRKLMEATGIQDRLSSSVKTLARQVWEQREPQIAPQFRDAAKAIYAREAGDLINSGHFQSAAYGSTAQVMGALGHMVASAVGQAVFGAAAPQGQPSGTATHGVADDAPKQSDEFAGWDPAAIRMYQTAMGAGGDRALTLADKAKQSRKAGE